MDKIKDRDALGHSLRAAALPIGGAPPGGESGIPRPLSADRQVEIDILFDRLASMPVLDARTPDEIIGYGPDGLPRQWS
jgi:hypothetical protein